MTNKNENNFKIELPSNSNTKNKIIIYSKVLVGLFFIAITYFYIVAPLFSMILKQPTNIWIKNQYEVPITATCTAVPLFKNKPTIQPGETKSLRVYTGIGRNVIIKIKPLTQELKIENRFIYLLPDQDVFLWSNSKATPCFCIDPQITNEKEVEQLFSPGTSKEKLINHLSKYLIIYNDSQALYSVSANLTLLIPETISEKQAKQWSKNHLVLPNNNTTAVLQDHKFKYDNVKQELTWQYKAQTHIFTLEEIKKHIK